MTQTQPRPVKIIPRSDHDISRKYIDENSLKVLYRLHRHGYKAYLVGGGVRDLLLGRHPKDFDIGTDATPEQVHKLFRNSRIVGRRFRLVHVLFGRGECIEVATFRRKPDENEIPDEGHFFCENVFGSPQEDAFRRDFTINALFYDIADFSVIDYTEGLEDLRRGIIRVIGDPDVRFAEDPVRMLRALEFSARLGFDLHADIAPAIERNAELLIGAAPARIRDELLELFHHKVAGKVLQRAAKLGLLEFLVPDMQPAREGFDLLRQLDLRTATGKQVDEPMALAVMFLTPFRHALNPDMPLGDVHKLANRELSRHCRRFSIASGIRHQAREMLIAFFRFARGRGRRGEQRFLRHPFAPVGFELFKLWCECCGEEQELMQSWSAALEGSEEQKPRPRGKPGSPRRRRKRKNPSPRP
ncbi:MAG: polynucleotide adenylyltransferase PcnB [Desulfuromonadaceae bacterium]|nr:polynucleotide adenylyltransferase PcnB [Geobacteraceae bacterium]